MSDINLFSQSTQRKALEKETLHFSPKTFALVSVMAITCVIALIVFLLNIFFTFQLNDKGNNLIELKKEQDSKYKTVIESINNYNSRVGAKNTIDKDKVDFTKITKDIDTAASNTVTSYTFNKESSAVSIKGTVNDINSVTDIVKKLRGINYLEDVRLSDVNLFNTTNYNYNISFSFNSEKI